MAIYKDPTQNLEYQVPDVGQFYKSTTEGANDRLIYYRQGGNIYQLDPSSYATIPWQTGGNWQSQESMMQSGLAALKSQYGLDYGALGAINPADRGNLSGGLSMGKDDWTKILTNRPTVQTGETITKTINPANMNQAMFSSSLTGGQTGVVPENYVQNLLGGKYTPQVATGAPQTRTLIDIANSRPDVLNTAKSQGGDPFTAGTKANTWLNNWWNSAGIKEYPGVTLGQPPTPPGMSAEQLQTQQNPINFQQGQGANTADSFVAGVTAYNQTLQNYITQLSAPPTEAENQQQDILNKIMGLTGQEAGKGAEQLAQEQAQNIPVLKAQLSDINGQILTKTAEYNALQVENQNKPITMNSIIGNERAILNAKAADLGLLTARAQAITGNLQTAQDTANRAVDLKYSTIEAQLNVYQAQLNVLQPILNKEQKILAQAQQMMIDERNQAIADAKTAEKNQTNYLLDLMSKYPDAGISLSDTIAQAQSKLANSRIYQEQVRPPQYAGAGVTGGGATGGEAAGTPTQDIPTALYTVGLPSGITTQKGKLSTDNLNKLTKAGIPPETAQGIIDAILQGNTLDDIRQYFRDNGVDPVILDTFMMTLQGVKSESSGSSNIEASKLEQLLDRL